MTKAACCSIRPRCNRAVPANRSCAAGRAQRRWPGRARAEPSTDLVYFRQEAVSVAPKPGETLLQVGANLPPRSKLCYNFGPPCIIVL